MRHKFNIRNDPASKLTRTIDGVLYASFAEARRAKELIILRSQGWHFEPHPKLLIGGVLPYKPDFYVHSPDGNEWYEDVKGAYYAKAALVDPKFKTVRRLWPKHCALPLVVLIGTRNGWEKKIIPPCKKGKT
jgi:hypothetical protein